MMQIFSDQRFYGIAEKVEAGERLSFKDGIAMYETSDLNGLGRLADYVRRQKHGLKTYFNVNRHLNHTNVCFVDCKFCNFYKKPREEGGYTYTIDECIEKARAAMRTEFVHQADSSVSIAKCDQVLPQQTNSDRSAIRLGHFRSEQRRQPVAAKIFSAGRSGIGARQ